MSALLLVPVPMLPTPRAGAVDYSAFGCETRARYAPQIGAGWEALRSMRKVA
jgi:hypothetical protein